MKKILLVSEDAALRVEPYASAFAGTDYSVVKMGVADSLRALKEDKSVASVLIDAPSKSEGIQSVIDYVNKTNSFVSSISILILTDNTTAEADLSYLGGAVIDCIRKPIHPLILLNRFKVAQRVANSASFSDFSHMLTALPSVIYLKDASGRYAFSSQAMGHLNISDPDMIRGKTDLDVRRDKGNAKIAMDADQALLHSGKGTSYVIQEDNHGEKEYLEIIKEPLYFSDGRTRGIIGLVNNVTEQEQLRLELRRISITDELTGLYNRSYYDEYIEYDLKNAKFPVSIVIADCDELKVVNDTYGHLAGDEYIRLSASAIRASLPEDAVLCRVGGDEFVAFIPDTDCQQAQRCIRSIRESMTGFKVQDHGLSVSFGCATLQTPQEDVEAALVCADNAMYQDKAVRRKERR